MTMQPPSYLALPIFLSLSIVPALGPEEGPIRVSAQVPKGAYYVGQAIPLQVAAVAGKERPAVVAPTVPEADVVLVGTDLKPLSATGIGDVVDERNLFVFRFRVVPRRAGTLEIPPVAVKDGGRSGTSRAIRLNVQSPLRRGGRPSSSAGSGRSRSRRDRARPPFEPGRRWTTGFA